MKKKQNFFAIVAKLITKIIAAARSIARETGRPLARIPITPKKIASSASAAPALKLVIDACLARSGLAITPAHEVDNLAMAISLVASTRGVALLPLYAENFLPRSLISRPLQGDVPTIDLVIGYSLANRSPVLKLFLSRVEDLITRVASTPVQNG